MRVASTRRKNATRDEQEYFVDLELQKQQQAECSNGTLWLYDFETKIWNCKPLYDPYRDTVKKKIEKINKQIGIFELLLKKQTFFLSGGPKTDELGDLTNVFGIEQKKKINLEISLDTLYQHIATLEILQDRECRLVLDERNWKAQKAKSKLGAFANVSKHVLSIATAGYLVSSPYEMERKKRCESFDSCQYYIPSVWSAKLGKKMQGTSGICVARMRFNITVLENEKSFSKAKELLSRYGELMEMEEESLTQTLRSEMVALKIRLKPIMDEVGKHWAVIKDLSDVYAEIQVIDVRVKEWQSHFDQEEAAKQIADLMTTRSTLVVQRNELMSGGWKNLLKEGLTVVAAIAVIAFIGFGIYKFFGLSSSSTSAIIETVKKQTETESIVDLTSSGGVVTGTIVPPPPPPTTVALEKNSPVSSSVATTALKISSEVTPPTNPSRMDKKLLVAAGGILLGTGTAAAYDVLKHKGKHIVLAKNAVASYWDKLTKIPGFDTMCKILNSLHVYVYSFLCGHLSKVIEVTSFISFFASGPFSPAITMALGVFTRVLCTFTALKSSMSVDKMNAELKEQQQEKQQPSSSSSLLRQQQRQKQQQITRSTTNQAIRNLSPYIEAPIISQQQQKLLPNRKQSKKSTSTSLSQESHLPPQIQLPPEQQYDQVLNEVPSKSDENTNTQPDIPIPMGDSLEYFFPPPLPYDIE